MTDLAHPPAVFAPTITTSSPATATPLTSQAAGGGGGTKKKFAAPPVKSACLACRAARTRCDGAKPCATCQSRSRECVYLPSRRGGPRCRKKPRPTNGDAPDEGPKQIPDNVFTMLSQEPADAPREPIPIRDYIDPGAGLKHLEDWVQDSDFIFDSLFMNSTGHVEEGNGFTSNLTGAEAPSHASPMVRTYQSDAAILDAYYVFIHPFLPILPPPYSTPPVDRPVPRHQDQLELFGDVGDGAIYEPSSPITLAIAAVLALIPCPEDTPQHSASHESTVFRRKYAQFFAQSAFEAVENDEEIPDSSIEPPRALSETHNHPFRRPFHPALPVECENVVALAILSVYEYAQRGNLKKMQNRAGQALMAAMDLSLHSCTIQDGFTEARRRVWWLSYICVAQGAIVNNSKPTFQVTSPTYVAEFPTIAADAEAFPIYIQAQRAILAATQFVIELNRAVKENADMAPIHDRMKELEAFLEPLLAHSESWRLPSTTTSPVDPTEEVVARSLRCMASIKLNSARIKVHRYCAFFDVPVFSRKHCDLKSLNAGDNDGEPRQWPTCSCSTFANPYSSTNVTTPTGSTTTNTAQSGLSPSSDGAGPGYGQCSIGSSVANTSAAAAQQAQQQALATPPPAAAVNLPFSSHQSAKICLKSALSIAHCFDELPFPNPTGAPPTPPPPPPQHRQQDNQAQQNVMFLSPTSGIVVPRTMPSFACCAMQCAYALLMVHQKTKTLYNPYPAYASPPDGMGGGAGPQPQAVNSLLVRLQQGLTSIYATLANYATAFEALGGMRDQIRSAVEDSAAFAVG